MGWDKYSLICSFVLDTDMLSTFIIRKCYLENFAIVKFEIENVDEPHAEMLTATVNSKHFLSNTLSAL